MSYTMSGGLLGLDNEYYGAQAEGTPDICLQLQFPEYYGELHQ